VETGEGGGDATPRGVGAPQATRSCATTSNKSIMRLILLTGSSLAHPRDRARPLRNPRERQTGRQPFAFAFSWL